MDKEKLAKHVRLCRRNMGDERVICCASCPFEEEIVGEYPEMAALFRRKRATVRRRKK